MSTSYQDSQQHISSEDKIIEEKSNQDDQQHNLDITDTDNDQSIQQVQQKSNEIYYIVELKKKFKVWEKLHSLSIISEVITIAISILFIALGIYISVSDKNGIESNINFIVSSSVFGVSGISILGGLFSIMRTCRFKSKLDTLDELYIKEKDLGIPRNFEFWELEFKNENEKAKAQGESVTSHKAYERSHRKPLYFMKKLVKHTKIMLMTEVMWAFVFSFLFILVATISIFDLINDYNSSAIKSYTEFLIATSVIALISCLGRLFIIKMAFPKMINDDTNLFNDKIDNIKDRLSDPLYFVGWIFVLIWSFFHGLISFKLELKRIDVSHEEMVKIKRILYGLALPKEIIVS
ncbi:859_t:CDS:1 [Racocetra persica]|uniref:859_t:CDS:1 n=1 Tax=Racocetra persica TaxID=160502 RepID=A0ACA9KYZ7_9GLOM|nr:859_t:CDS:1 [Racocetra persica]